MRRAIGGCLLVVTGVVVSCGSKRRAPVADSAYGPRLPADGGNANDSVAGEAASDPVAGQAAAGKTASGGTPGRGGTGSDNLAAGAGGAGESETPAYGNYQLVVADAPWANGQDDLGITVDADSNPYIQDQNQIYVVKGGVVEPYLSVEDLASLYGYVPGGHFQDIDYGPDKKLYILFGRSILRSTTAHKVELWLDLSDMKAWVSSQAKLGVISNSQAFLVVDAGAFRVSDIATEKQFESDVLKWSQGCAVEDLAVTSRGTFVYQPGCTAYPTYRGQTDGGLLGTMYPAPKPEFGLAASEFNCWGKGAGGGFVTVAWTPYQTVENGMTVGKSELRLYHLDEDSNRPAGVLLEVLTAAKQSVANKEDLAFHYCGVVGAPDASVWVTTFNQLWRFAP